MKIQSIPQKFTLSVSAESNSAIWTLSGYLINNFGMSVFDFADSQLFSGTVNGCSIALPKDTYTLYINIDKNAEPSGSYSVDINGNNQFVSEDTTTFSIDVNRNFSISFKHL